MTEYVCAAGRSCRDREKVTASNQEGEVVATFSRWQPATIEAERGLCERCEYAVKRALWSLTDDWGILSDAVGDKLVSVGEHVSGTHEAPIPLNTAVLALRSTLSEWAEVALGIVCPELNIEPRERQRAKGYPIREYAVVSQAYSVLPENLRILLDSEAQPVNVWNRSGMSPSMSESGRTVEELDGVDVALHMLRTHWQVRNVLGDSNPRTRLSMPCPVLGCGSMTLGVDNGETDVNCTSCGGHWSDREYKWLAGMIVSETETRTKEKKTVLEWLLAEKTWLLLQARATLESVGKLAWLEEVEDMDLQASTVLAMLRELVA